MKEKMGFMVFALGIMSADSEWIAVPIALLIAGTWLMRKWVTR